MRARWRGLAVPIACLLAATACGGSKSTHHKSGQGAASTGSGSSHSTTTTSAGGGAPGSESGTGGANTTTTRPHTLLQALLAQGRTANVKVIYATPDGHVTLIRRGTDSVYADGTGIRFRLGALSYDCTGTGDGETCTRIQGDATQSDVDAYTGLVADALAEPSNLVHTSTVSLIGRTAECVSIIGRQAARAGSSVQACIDDGTGVLLTFATLGPPDPGTKLTALAVGAPSDPDFQLPVPPT